MRTLLFALLVALNLPAQSQTVTYSLDFARLDSFFLVERASQFFNGSPRPQVVMTEIPFRDTSELTAFARKLETELADSNAELAALQRKNDFMRQRLTEINRLRKNGVWAYAIIADPLPPAPAEPPPAKKKAKAKKSKTL